ncbi:MAG: hypothetical protein SFU20_02420 [Chitinophagaceae bacterium]|nr:hypothetical protein [Chitinophagaceae bacterium]
MRTIKILSGLLMMLAFTVSCTREEFDDLSLVASGTAPANLSVLFEITQDNTGNVTITPNGEGVSSYEVYYGDGTTVPAKVNPGKNTTHRYAEGQYPVKIVAYGITGKTTEFTQQLTVSFRAPENLDVTMSIDPNNNFKVNVSATATYETNFRVYFGDVPNEVPITFIEGQTVSHTYAAVGDYTIKVVALSGGAATTEFSQVMSIVDPVLLPLTFESSTINYAFNNFDGGDASVIANPQIGGINTSAKVGRMIKNPGQVWGGSWIGLGNAIDFSTNKYFLMKVFSPRVGAKVLLKVENASNGAIAYEKEVTTTVANAWEDLLFDYTAINTANQYHHIVLIFELGTAGDGTANFTFLFDDIRLVSTPPPAISLPLDFESTSLTYNFTNFDGGDASVIANPHSGGINSSAKVGRMIKNNGQPWGGSFITLNGPIDFTNKYFRMKVYSPRVGAKVLLKVENSANAAQNYEKEVTTTVANGWEDLVFDYTAINTTQNYDRIVLIFELGTVGDGSANFTFYFDDIRLVATAASTDIALPLDFESTTLTYSFTNFDGGDASVIANPHSGGINTSAKVGRMIKNAGQPWGGSWIGLTNPINFGAGTTFKMKVYSPRVGAKVLLKVENQTNGGISYEKEVTTTVANAWEELTFDYSGINLANTYQKIVLIFDLGTVGDGSSNFTFYFDDIKLN